MNTISTEIKIHIYASIYIQHTYIAPQLQNHQQKTDETKQNKKPHLKKKSKEENQIYEQIPAKHSGMPR